MNKTIKDRRQRLARFLFPDFPDAAMAPPQLKVTTLSFYAILATSIVALPTTLIRDVSAGNKAMIVSQVIYIALLLGGLFFLWAGGSLRQVRICFGLAVAMLIAGLIASAGGARGLGFFYIIAGYPVLYHVLGLSGGVAVPLIVAVGIYIRSRFGSFPAQSLLNDPDLWTSFFIVINISTILGVFSVVYQHSIVHSLYVAAYIDELTGLASCRKINQALEARIQAHSAGGKGFSLISVKLLHFSRVNSFQGSGFADGLLRAVGERLQACVGSDAVLSRCGGTIFQVLTDQSDFIDLDQLGKRLLEAAQRPIQSADQAMALESLVAITRFPQDGIDREALQSNIMASFARMRGHSGKVCFYDEDLHHAEAERFFMIEELRGAIEAGELSLVYQAKRHLKDGSCQGAEVLLRWRSKRFGEVPPAQFIPLAEEAGLIQEISRWVIRTATEELSSLPHRGPSLVHAINLSPKDLISSAFREFLWSMLKSGQIKPESIEFEITEGMMMDENPAIQHTLGFIREAGCRLAIDDFGTGYSSLSYLHRIRANNLKIDQSFIRGISASNPVSPVVDAIISMALSLKLDITAEGVETPFQEAYLKERGCTYAQGWLYARAVPLAEYKALLTRGLDPA
ncbi:MAG TPA: hypothetical protein DCG47_09300 [Spirochaetaceae bacterium]|jgi:diguanylate cyclase (GGDEF)-like protein|nr:hypothetical protein [Spirochaetaceae bacterium]